MNYIVWVAYWLGSFCILEGLAAAKGLTQKYLGFQVPWDTFSTFIWNTQTIRIVGTPITLGVLFVLSVLLAHLPRYKNLSEGDKKEPHEEKP